MSSIFLVQNTCIVLLEPRAYKASIFEHHLDNVKNLTRVKHWLEEWHPLVWYRCGFTPAIKCDYITNNIVEVFNNWIKDYKDLTFCELANKKRTMVMELFFRQKMCHTRI